MLGRVARASARVGAEEAEPEPEAEPPVTQGAAPPHAHKQTARCVRRQSGPTHPPNLWRSGGRNRIHPRIAGKGPAGAHLFRRRVGH